MSDLHAIAAGAAAPTSDKARSRCSGAGPSEPQNRHLDSVARAERDQRVQAIATARARAALAGFTLQLIPSEDGAAAFLLARWNLSRTLPDVAAVTAFLDEAGARHA